MRNHLNGLWLAPLLLLLATPAAAGMIPIAGDINEDGVVNAVDVQIVINVALGVTDNPKADITHSGTVNAQDVQLVINAALGIEIDSAGNGLADAAEINLGTDPNLFDTSGDGIPDGVAVALGLDPLVQHDIDAELLVTPAAPSLTVGETVPLEVFSTFPYHDVDWRLDGQGVVELTDEGLLMAVGAGEAELTATDTVSGSSASTRVAVLTQATGEDGASAIQRIAEVRTDDPFPNQVASLEDGRQVPLGNEEYIQHLEDGTPDLSTQPAKTFAFKEAGRPEPDRISLDAWQTPIRHQRDRNTCSAFTVVAAMEAAYKRAGYASLTEAGFSEQFIHHVSKQQYLYPWHDRDDEPTQDGYESSLGMRGNAGVRDVLTRVMMYQIPLETNAPYQHTHRVGHSWGDYENTNQSGDFPRISSDRDGSIQQSDANVFNMEVEPATFQVPGDMTFAPLPQQALENAVFGITGYVTANTNQVRDPAWYEWRIAEGKEILASFSYRFTVDDDGVQHPRDLNDGESPGWHAMLIVGYDRTDPDNPYLIVKNSWGESDYIKLSYDFILATKDARISDANYITGVLQPKTGQHHPTLYLGGWRLVRDGQGGIFDIHRQAQFYSQSRAGNQDDNRLGAFFRLGNTHRVNGWLNDDGTAEFYIDDFFRNLPYGALEGDRHEAHLHPDDARLLAGSFYDGNETRRPFYANKGDFWQGVARFEQLSHTSFLGRWEVHGAGADGWVHILGVNEANNTFGGDHISPNTPDGAFFMAINGSVNPATQEIQFTFPNSSWQDGNLSFDGQIHAHSQGTISGLGTKDNGEVYPVVLIREGPATRSVNITTPNDGDTFQIGETVHLECEVFDDGIPPEGNPLVIWTRQESQDDSSTQIGGSGTSTATKLGAGLHTITANYHDESDQITVIVESAEDPAVAITQPDDGEFIHDLTNAPFVHVDFSGVALASGGGFITGDSLRWYYRESGDSEWTDSGERGAPVTLTLRDTNSHAATWYEIMLEAEDSHGNIGVDVITISVFAFGS